MNDTPMLREAGTALLQYVVASALMVEKKARYKMSQVVRGVALLVAGVFISCLGVLFVLLALFFQLADVTMFVQPALITGGVGLLASLLLIFNGWRYIMRS